MAERTLEDRLGKPNATIVRAIGKALGWADRELMAQFRLVGRGAQQVGDDFVWLLEEVLAKVGPAAAWVMYETTKHDLDPEMRARADAIMQTPVAELQAERAAARDERAATQRQAQAQAARPDLAGAGIVTPAGRLADPSRGRAPQSVPNAQRGLWNDVYQGFLEAGFSPEEAEERANEAVGIEPPAPLLGVPEDFTLDAPRLGTQGRSPDAIMAGQQGRQRAPIYRDGSEQRPFGWSAEEIAGLQRKLVEAGLLSGSFRSGWYDAPTQTAYRSALGFANQRGTTVNHALQLLAGQRDEEKAAAREQFQAEPFLPPDPATLRNKARDALVAMGRRPGEFSEAELEQMVAVGTGAWKAQHDMEQEQARRELDVELDNLDRMPGDPVAQVDVSGIETVDPTARFDEWFTQHYAGEISTRDTAAKVARSGALFDAGVQGMRGQVARGGV